MKEQNIRGHKLSALEREAQISNKLEIEIFILTCQVIPEAVAVFLTDRQTDRQTKRTVYKMLFLSSCVDMHSSTAYISVHTKVKN